MPIKKANVVIMALSINQLVVILLLFNYLNSKSTVNVLTFFFYHVSHQKSPDCSRI